MMTALNRRDFVKGTAAGIASSLALGSLNVANAVAESSEGLVYKGRARGMRGHVTVYVTLDGERIVDVQVGENTEAPDRISKAAIAVVPSAIVEAQSVDVDTVTGATITSLAIMSAATEALEAAGVASQFAGPAPAPQAEVPQDCECDVLVVGSGAAGCNAAIAASYSDYGKTPSGLKVILVEKQGFTGGSTCLAGGTFCTTQPLNSTANVEKYFEDAYPSMSQEGYPMNKELARNLLMVAGTNALQNQQLGFSIVTINGLDAPDQYTELLGWYDQPRPDFTTFGEGHWAFRGYVISDYMDEGLERCGVDVRLNTRAVELMTEGGSVTGAVVETPAGSYAIKAKKVILATGGFGQNPEYVAQYAPTYVDVLKYMNAGCTGDAISLAAPLGAVVDGFDSAGGPLGIEVHFGAFHDMGYDFYQGVNFPVGYGCVIVNTEGQRFMADSHTIVSDEHVMPRMVMEQPGSMAWSVFDSANAAAGVADASIMQEAIFRADTIAELAEKIGVPAENLVATVEAYNAMQASGTDDEELGVPAADMEPVTQPPFYAVQCIPTICFVTEGLRVGPRCEVVTEAGDTVPNLYACGEAAYQGTSIDCLGGAMAGGRLAGDTAREEIAQA